MSGKMEKLERQGESELPSINKENTTSSNTDSMIQRIKQKTASGVAPSTTKKVERTALENVTPTDRRRYQLGSIARPSLSEQALAPRPGSGTK